MSDVATKAPTPSGTFNYELHVKELSDSFGRLVKQLGVKNSKDWKAKPPKACLRYQYEVDFAYALNDLKNCPIYLRGKLYDNASSVVAGLIAHLRAQQEAAEPTA